MLPSVEFSIKPWAEQKVYRWRFHLILVPRIMTKPVGKHMQKWITPFPPPLPRHDFFGGCHVSCVICGNEAMEKNPVEVSDLPRNF